MDLTCLLVSFQKTWGLKYWAAHPYQLPPILIIGKIDNNDMQYLDNDIHANMSSDLKDLIRFQAIVSKAHYQDFCSSAETLR